MPTHPKAKIFDRVHRSFNPLQDIDKKKARELADALYTASPQGGATLTVRNGRRALARGLAEATRLDKVSVHSPIKGVAEEVEGMPEELLFTDVVPNVVARMTSLLLPESTEKFLRDLTGPSWAILIV